MSTIVQQSWKRCHESVNCRLISEYLIEGEFFGYNNGGNVSQAAKVLQIGRNTLYRKMSDYRIQLPGSKEGL